MIKTYEPNYLGCGSGMFLPFIHVSKQVGELYEAVSLQLGLLRDPNNSHFLAKDRDSGDNEIHYRRHVEGNGGT